MRARTALIGMVVLPPPPLRQKGKRKSSRSPVPTTKPL